MIRRGINFMLNVSKKVSFETHNDKVVALKIEHDGNMSVERLLGYINDVDMDYLRYRPAELRRLCIKKVEIIKKLEEEWSGEVDLLPQLIHPDSFLRFYDTEICNCPLREHGMPTILRDGKYKVAYIGQESSSMVLNSLMRGVVDESSLLPTRKLLNTSFCTGDSSVALSWFYACDGILVIASKTNARALQAMDTLEKSLKTGNLLLLNDTDKSTMYFVFSDNLRG